MLADIGDDDVLYRRIAPGQIDRKRPERVVSVVFRVGGRPPGYDRGRIVERIRRLIAQPLPE